jgi:hypothetical protein
MARDGNNDPDSIDDAGNGDGSPWNAKQETIATLLVTGRSIREIAGETGISERTINQWLYNYEYSRYIASLRRQVLTEALGRLTDACVGAALTLRALMDTDQRPNIRLYAAKSILESVVAIQRHIDFDERLARLEARDDEQHQWPSDSA